MEADGSGNALYYYIYGPSGLISRISNSNETHYYVYDYRGSTVAMTDASNAANITHKYQYDDFGKLLQSQEADENLFRYVGKYGVMYENDDLAFMRARYYDPGIGRFLSEDPVWSTYLYPYADNNPIMGIDPNGLYTRDVLDGVLKTTVTSLMQNTRRARFLVVADYAIHGTSKRQVVKDVLWEVAGALVNFGAEFGGAGSSALLAPIKVEIDLIGAYADAVADELDAINKLTIASDDLRRAELARAEMIHKEKRDRLFGMLNNSFAGNDLTKQRWVITYKAAQTMPEALREKALDGIYREMKQQGF